MFLLKWFIFLFIGLPIQGLVYILYPFIYIIWLLFVHSPIESKTPPQHDFSASKSVGADTIHNGALLDNTDDHAAFSMYGFIQKEGLELFEADGSLIRKLNPDGTMNRWAVSGDVMVGWFFANELATRKASDEVIKRVVNTYMKNLGTLSYDETAQGYVSDRCSNFGVNYAPDSAIKITQPATGPQFYTTSTVLAGAYHLGLKHKAMFWAHWLVMGGWYWAWAPMITPNDKDWYYVRDMTMKALYVHLQVFGPRWWITKPMKFINDKITPAENDLFNAMMKRRIGLLPDSMDSFFSQHKDASSRITDRMSPYIPDAIRKIQAESKWK